MSAVRVFLCFLVFEFYLVLFARRRRARVFSRIFEFYRVSSIFSGSAGSIALDFFSFVGFLVLFGLGGLVFYSVFLIVVVFLEFPQLSCVFFVFPKRAGCFFLKKS